MLNIDITKPLYGSNGNMILDVNLKIEDGDFVALTGKSGSGKSTLLRILAGLERAEGEISLNGVVWQDKTNILATQKRGIGFVFQDYALFNNMSVEDNLLFVKKDKKLANHLLDITELQELKDRLPHNLSGGQKQRVSLCRALMNNPKLLLMDEPLSALDPNMRKKLQDEILILHREFKTTTIMVSHDPSEIYHLASRVVVLDQGEIKEEGTPQDILLKNSNNLSFEGEILDIVNVNNIFMVVVIIRQELVEIKVDLDKAKSLNIGDRVRVGLAVPNLRIF